MDCLHIAVTDIVLILLIGTIHHTGHWSGLTYTCNQRKICPLHHM